MIRFSLIAALAFLSVFTFQGCGNSDTASKGELTAADTASAAQADITDELPSPQEMAGLIKESGAKYNPALTNDISNISKYATSSAKAINLGVYCSDVGYTTLFKQTQETMFYLNNCRKLSDDIGLSNAFDKTVFDRVEANIDIRDSLLDIISETYSTANTYLRANNRYGTFMLMMAGGWIESMHLACNMALDKNANAEIAVRVSEQEGALDKIIKSMEAFKGEDAVNDLLAKLTQIKSVLASGKIATKADDGKITVDYARLKKVAGKISEVRNGIIGE